MSNEPQCHICGQIAPLYVVHEISMYDMPTIRINVFYCKKCAQLVDAFEQYLAKVKTNG